MGNNTFNFNQPSSNNPYGIEPQQLDHNFKTPHEHNAESHYQRNANISNGIAN